MSRKFFIYGSRWKRILLRSLPLAYFALMPFAHAADEWHTFTDMRGRQTVAKIQSVGHDFAILVIKASGAQYSMKFDDLDEDDVEYIKKYDASKPAPEAKTQDDGADAEGDASKQLYPRTREEIKAGLRDIKRQPLPKGLSPKVHEAVIALNSYRFLSGLSSDVEGDITFSTNSTDAAQACKANGGLSHSIGHSTDKCNLSSGGDMLGSVTSYMQDGGDNNRAQRGHRAWCLNPPMGKVGFGSAGDSYSAMWCMDGSGKGKTPEIWGYPGRGFYPIEYFHGNAWSVFFSDPIGDVEKVNIEVFRLNKRPEKALPLHGEINGRVVPVNYKAKSMHNGINFEPEDPSRKGIYWVRVTGGGMRAGYLVELY